MKLSYYTIFSDPVNAKKDSVLYCTRTGSVFVVSERIRNLLISNQISDIPENEVKRLMDAGGIVPEEEVEISTIIKENVDYIATSDILYEVIQPSANCQLGCYYCGQSHAKHSISDTLYDSLVDRIRSKLGRRKYRKLIIGWFGAEPLMGLPAIRDLTPRLRKLSSEFNIEYEAKMVTNGLSLKENIFLELVKELSVKNFEITLDGSSEYHDKHRYTKKNEDSFDLIFSNLSNILNRYDYNSLGCGISIRSNIDENNFEGFTPLINLLADNDLQYKISYLYPIGIYSWGLNDAHKKSLSKEDFAQAEIDWYIQMLEKGFHCTILPGRRKNVCIVVDKESEMYDAYGNIFNCTEASYVKAYEGTDYILGNLRDKQNSKVNPRKFNDWNNEVLNNDKFPCHSCKLFPVCGGCCPKAWHEDLRACPSFKFNIKDRLKLFYITSVKDIHELISENEDNSIVFSNGESE